MAGYSGTPLLKKLGIRPGSRILVLNPPRPYAELVEGLPPDLVDASGSPGQVDFIHLFVRQVEELRASFPICKERLASNGMLWVSWPKRGSGLPTTLNEAMVRELGLSNGLVDVKVCAVDAHWSGLRFVFRVKDRK